MEYRTDCDGVSPEDLRGFFVGWPNPPDEAPRLRILRGSSHVAVAVDGGVVVGFATAITDGVLAAYIPLLEVLPSHQGLGIGTELIRTLLGQLDGHYMIDTACDDDVVGFYERLGFQRGNAMTRRDYAAQPGKKMTSLLDSGCL